MLLIGDRLERELPVAADAVRQVYGIGSTLRQQDCGAFFPPRAFPGYGIIRDLPGLYDALHLPLGKRVLILTDRDLFLGDQPEDDWIFGYSQGGVAVVSAARLRGKEGRPQAAMTVPDQRYRDRLQAMALHEIGHEVVRNPRFTQAQWVNARTGHRLALGLHCTDRRCVMYEIVDLRAPPPEEGWVELGGERRADAGLDDVLERRHPGWLCGACHEAIRAGDACQEGPP
ncbi:MAG: hypothetical protein HY520_01810 [Candidatus Aenigmarchaeota archaeon]|nr:hypothetical protein [Candidatus Aenigmarchaeota archaeon]